VRALVDRHHADLYYSLQLLLEDRLGIELYTPIGHEWWDEGIWNFGRGTWPDDRLAQQYLNPEPWAENELHDGHHPERAIRGIGYAEARELGWDYVVATLQDNQHGFRKFADEVGAKFVMQVGNTGQLVDWGLDPLALVSSEVPIRGRGVLYHQEFEAETTFRFRDLEDPLTIRSFVNCFPETPCHAAFGEVRDLLPEFRFESYGIGTPGDVVTPVGRIADLMAGSGWGWHDKAHGDGFGHVIHNWAAVGRPLIGHASHYRGRMAEMFWDDLVTCIDLDRYSVSDATGLIREITADRPRHEAMCREIRARFDTIDYAAEAEAIREFLA
jgi:hypothetical protein